MLRNINHRIKCYEVLRSVSGHLFVQLIFGFVFIGACSADFRGISVKRSARPVVPATPAETAQVPSNSDLIPGVTNSPDPLLDQENRPLEQQDPALESLPSYSPIPSDPQATATPGPIVLPGLAATPEPSASPATEFSVEVATDFSAAPHVGLQTESTGHANGLLFVTLKCIVNWKNSEAIDSLDSCESAFLSASSGRGSEQKLMQIRAIVISASDAFFTSPDHKLIAQLVSENEVSRAENVVNGRAKLTPILLPSRAASDALWLIIWEESVTEAHGYKIIKLNLNGI